MSEASWAAAGMLAAHDPEHPPELRDLAEFSIGLLPGYLRLIEDLSGQAVPLRTTAALIAGEASTGHTLSAEQARRRIPQLQTNGRTFRWLEETSLDPRDLCRALPTAAAGAGVDLREGVEVLSVTSHAEGVEVSTSKGTWSANAFVNCQGAWSGLGVEPRKGQIFKVSLQPPLDLPCVIRTPEIYLVPRGNGEVVIGASVEQVGFDRRVDPSVIDRLLAQAAELWPPAREARIVESWTGLRPGTADGLPLIGPDPSCRHGWVASGHFRNGILLAPGTAVLVRELLQGESPSLPLAAFSPARLSDKALNPAL
jgi:glycine oxidase